MSAGIDSDDVPISAGSDSDDDFDLDFSRFAVPDKKEKPPEIPISTDSPGKSTERPPPLPPRDVSAVTHTMPSQSLQESSSQSFDHIAPAYLTGVTGNLCSRTRSPLKHKMELLPLPLSSETACLAENDLFDRSVSRMTSPSASCYPLRRSCGTSSPSSLSLREVKVELNRFKAIWEQIKSLLVSVDRLEMKVGFCF